MAGDFYGKDIQDAMHYAIGTWGSRPNPIIPANHPFNQPIGQVGTPLSYNDLRTLRDRVVQDKTISLTGGRIPGKTTTLNEAKLFHLVNSICKHELRYETDPSNFSTAIYHIDHAKDIQTVVCISSGLLALPNNDLEKVLIRWIDTVHNADPRVPYVFNPEDELPIVGLTINEVDEYLKLRGITLG